MALLALSTNIVLTFVGVAILLVALLFVGYKRALAKKEEFEQENKLILEDMNRQKGSTPFTDLHGSSQELHGEFKRKESHARPAPANAQEQKQPASTETLRADPRDGKAVK